MNVGSRARHNWQVDAHKSVKLECASRLSILRQINSEVPQPAAFRISHLQSNQNGGLQVWSIDKRCFPSCKACIKDMAPAAHALDCLERLFQLQVALCVLAVAAV